MRGFVLPSLLMMLLSLVTFYFFLLAPHSLFGHASSCAYSVSCARSFTKSVNSERHCGGGGGAFLFHVGRKLCPHRNDYSYAGDAMRTSCGASARMNPDSQIRAPFPFFLPVCVALTASPFVLSFVFRLPADTLCSRKR